MDLSRDRMISHPTCVCTYIICLTLGINYPLEVSVKNCILKCLIIRGKSIPNRHETFVLLQYIYMYMYAQHIYLYLHIYMYICICRCIYIIIYIYIHVCTNVWTFIYDIYVYIYIWVYTYTYAHTYIYIYIYIYMHMTSWSNEFWNPACWGLGNENRAQPSGGLRF